MPLSHCMMLLLGEPSSSVTGSVKKEAFLQRPARLKSIQYSVWWAAQSKTLARFHLFEKKGEMCGKHFPCRNPNGLALFMMNTGVQSQRGCPSAHEILRGGCHPNLCRFYGDIKSLIRADEFASGWLLQVLKISVCTCHARWIELILIQNL